MRIIGIDIQNFRKLFGCHIDISKETTLFVGANNSGKTSAMDALAKFLANRSFVFSVPPYINQGLMWLQDYLHPED